MGPSVRRWFGRGLGVGIAVALIVPVLAGVALATIGQIKEFNTPTGTSQPRGVALGPDGNIWFTECNNGAAISAVGNVTPSGTFTEFSTPTASACPTGITAGPDGNMWFTERSVNKIGKITMGGAITEYTICGGCTRAPAGIVTGPDGNMWFTNYSGNSVAKMNTSGTVLNTYSLPVGSNPYGIASGPDGRLWVAETGTGSGSGALAAVDTSGSITTYNLPCVGCASPQDVTVGPDGDIWFTETGNNGAFPAIGSIIPSGPNAGDTTEAIVPSGSTPFGIVTGPDSNIWFTDQSGFVGRYNPTSANFTEFVDPLGNALQDIAVGNDGNLWFASGGGANQIGRVRLSWPLNLTINGTGFGSVTSSPAGIDCPATTCSNHFIEGTQVILTPTPQPGSRFVGWNGFAGCSGTGPCTVTMKQAQSVTATFNTIYQLSVSETGSGAGTVTASPDPQGFGEGPQFDKINCPTNCSTYYDAGTVVTLTETPANNPSTGSVFGGWGGDGASCGTATTCPVTMSQARSVTANFIQTWQLTVNTSGSGGGTVSSNPTGITCPSTCQASFQSGTPVTLTATPNGTSVFGGWSGGGCSGTSTCQVPMTADTTVTATFKPNVQPDGLIALGAKTPIGEGVFNSTGAGQTVTGKVLPGATAIFNVTVQNDGLVADTIQLHGAAKLAGFTVKYFAGTTNITTPVTSGAYATASLAPAGTALIQIRITASKTAKIGAVYNDLLTASSVADPTKADAVKAVVKVK